MVCTEDLPSMNIDQVQGAETWSDLNGRKSVELILVQLKRCFSLYVTFSQPLVVLPTYYIFQGGHQILLSIKA